MIKNIHTREIQCSAATLGALLDHIAEAGNPLWPAAWPPLILDRPLAAGAVGGHGPIRYSITEYEAGRRISCRFDPSVGIVGSHTFSVAPTHGGAMMRHELVGRATGCARLSWPFATRWLHDALIEDLFDRAATAVGQPPTSGAKWSWWVRRARAVAARKRPGASGDQGDRGGTAKFAGRGFGNRPDR